MQIRGRGLCGTWDQSDEHQNLENGDHLMLKDRPLVSAIKEWQVDYLVLLLCHGSEPFVRFLSDRVGVEVGSEGVFGGAWHSVIDFGNRESDLEIKVKDRDGNWVGILVENKIDATFQEDQDGRYHRRGEEGLAEGEWQRYVTCLLAPASYLEGTGGLEWDRSVAYEDVAAWLDSQRDDPYATVMATIFRQAILKKDNIAATKEISEPITEFFREYFAYCQRVAPGLCMKPPTPKTDNGYNWIWFGDSVMPSGQAVQLYHKPDSTEGGAVELRIRYCSSDRIATALAEVPAYQSLMETGDFVLEERKKARYPTTYFKIKLDVVDIRLPFVGQVEAIAKAVESASKLMDLYLAGRDAINQAADSLRRDAENEQ